MVALSVILFPPLLIAFLLVMERVEEPLRRPASPREVDGVPRHGDARRGRHPRAVRHPARAVPLAAPPPAGAATDAEPAAWSEQDLLPRSQLAAGPCREADLARRGTRRPPIG